MLNATLTVDADADAATFELIVENTGEDAIELTFPTGQNAEFRVTRDGRAVWTWSSGRAFTQAMRARTLAPGESVIATGEWQRPDPGAYRVEAELEAMTDVRAAAAFSVE